MKKFLVIALILASSVIHGQITRKIQIWEKPMTHEVMTAHFNPDSTISIHFMARDARYSALIEYVTLFFGSPIDFYAFLEELELFIKESEGFKEESLSKKINGQMVSISKMYGVTSMSIDEKDGSGYGGFVLKSLPKFKEKFVQWAEKNNVVYKVN